MSLTPSSPQRVNRPKPPLIDQWSIREKLALASSVSKSGDQNWHSTSRMLRGFAETNRPNDWFSQKNCALQYEDMLEQVEQPKRKRGERGEETVQDVILRDLTLKRIAECRQLIATQCEKMRMLRQEAELLNKDDPPQELVQKLLQRKKDEEAEAEAAEIRHQQWLKEREAKIEAAKRTTRQNLIRTRSIPPVPTTPVVIKVEDQSTQPAPADAQDESSVQSATESNDPATPISINPPVTSPLLTSLLQSPSGSSSFKDPKETVSPSKPMPGSVFFNQTGSSPARVAGQLHSVSPARVSLDDSQPSAAPTLSKLLEMPLSSSGNKLPPLPIIEKETSVGAKVCDLTDDSTQSGDLSDSGRSVGKFEIKEEDDESKSDSRTDEQESKTPLTRRQRELRPRAVTSTTTSVSSSPAAAGHSVSTPSATPASSSSSQSTATRRSGRIRGIRESESESSERKAPAGSDDPNSMDASASEESQDAPSRLSNMPLSKAPSVSDSFPNSPASTMHSEDADAERERKRWLKEILALWKLANTHKYATTFQQPAHKEVGESYNEAIKRPMDLTSIKKRIENPTAENAIRTTAEFQRDMLLMFQNAIMFNRKGHDVHEIALEMQKEIGDAIEEFAASEKQNQSQSGTASGSETPSMSLKQASKPKRPPATATSSQTQEEASGRRRSRTSTDTDPGSAITVSVPLTRTAMKKKAAG